MNEKILTLHPEGKNGVNIAREKYDVMREVILDNLRQHAPLTFTALGEIVREALRGKFEGSVSWYFTTVKLDLEARGEIKRIKSAGKTMLTPG